MVSTAVPKEKLSAYQRWEMASFNEDKPNPNALREKKKQENTDNAVRSILQGVREEAYKQGLESGYEAGMAQAQAQIEQERLQLQAIAKTFTQALTQNDERIAESVLTLSLELAKAMLKAKLDADPKAIIPVVLDAIHYLPQVQKPARLMVHHEDAKLLREYLADELAEQDWLVIEDNHIERGGCLVETGENHIDATNETRWKRITQGLSRHDAWLIE